MMTADPSRKESAVNAAPMSMSNPGSDGKVFGLPLGNFGLFASLLIAFSSGFLSFFLTTFFAIFGILFYNTAGHHSVDFAIAYKLIALPIGLAVLAVSLLFFGFLWIRRKFAGN